MAPTDLTLERDRRAAKRLALTVRHARLAAEGDEAALISRLLDAIDAGAMTVADAHHALRGLQRDQQTRRAA